MKTISLESLMDARQSAQPQSAASITEQEMQTAQAASELTPQDREALERIKASIDLNNSQASVLYASQTQKELADFSGSILSGVKNSNLGNTGEMLSHLLAAVQGFHIGEMEERGFFPNLFSRAKSRIDALFSKYQAVENQVDKIASELETANDILLKDIIMYDKLYAQNLKYFKELQLYIAAGEETCEEMRRETLPRLREEAANSGEPMAAQVVRDFEQNVERFEKKVHDLKTSKIIALQTAPQIKLIQNNDKLLMDKIQESIHTTIPFWKSQMVIALGLEHQGKIVAMQKEISDTTNRMIRENADKLKSGTIEVAREAERSLVDVETLKHANARLIETIGESLRVHEEARAQRALAEQELLRIESDLRSAVLSAAQYAPGN